MTGAMTFPAQCVCQGVVALVEVGKQPRFVELHCKFADVSKMAVELILGVAGAAL